MASVYYVSGNWDYGDESTILRRSGAIPIEGRTKSLRINGQRIVLAGLGWYRIKSLPGFDRAKNPKLFHVIVTHTCDGFETAAARGVDLYLCGHHSRRTGKAPDYRSAAAGTLVGRQISSRIILPAKELPLCKSRPGYGENGQKCAVLLPARSDGD